MKNALRFLWYQYMSTILKANLVLGVLILGLNYVTPDVTIFGTYLMMYPIFPIMLLVIYGYSLTTLYRDMALSFQCRRTDLFWGSQISFLVCGVGCTAILAAVGVLANRFLDLTAMAEGFPALAAGLLWGNPKFLPFLLVMGICLQPMGAALGCLYNKHKIIATVILVVLMLLSVVGTALSFFLADGTLSLPGWLLPGMGGTLMVGAAVSEVYYYRNNANAVVR